MDEVDLDNVDDINDLESRLYAQIHHDAAPVDAEAQEQCNGQQLETHVTTQITTICKNQISNGDDVAAVAVAVADKITDTAAIANHRENVSRYWLNNSRTNGCNRSKPVIQTSSNQITEPSTSNMPPSKKQKSKGNTSSSNDSTSHVDSTAGSSKQASGAPKRKQDLRVNPAALHAAKLKLKNKQQNNTSDSSSHQDGPFARQVVKLQKAMRIEAKKQKSKQARAKKKEHQQSQVETIVLQSSEGESADDDDIVEVPIPPAPVYTIDDSDDNDDDVDNQTGKGCTLQIEENGVDSFIKPLASEADKGVDNSSRSTSPSSAVSIDSFIAQADRKRLRMEEHIIADDEDLLMLTADLIENQNALYGERIREETTQPSTSKQADENNIPYRVTGSCFKAMDVYESESDNVYSKGSASKKRTVIRNLESSSDEASNIGAVESIKTKLLRKKKSNGNATDDDDESSESANGVRTGIPFISRGPAVEQRKKKLRKISSKSRRTSGGATSGGHMSESEFLAALHTLAQGRDLGEEEHEDEDDDDEDSEVVNAPTAREIAEKVLKTQRKSVTRAGIVRERSISSSTYKNKDTTTSSQEESAPMPRNAANMLLPSASDVAIPDEIATQLEKAFEAIDQSTKKRNVPDEPNDSNNSDVELVPSSAIDAANKKLIPKMEPTDPVYNIVYSEKNDLPGGLGWNDEMRRFYNDSWRGERFNVKDLWRRMNPNKHLWKIYTEDRFTKSRRFSNLKCHNCCEFGHVRAKCPRRKKPPLCYICGEEGHYEPRCPNTVCLRCGNKTHVFTKSCNACTFQNRLICPICKVRGHTLNFCPDKWRRYHSTTQRNVYPNNQVEYNNIKYCCICGGRGHLSDHCRSAVRFNEYPTIVSHIKSHQKSYEDVPLRNLGSVLSFNLLYIPHEDISFELAEQTTANKYYGRFLKAVGLDYLLRRKRKSSNNMMITSTLSPAKKKIQSKNVRERNIDACTRKAQPGKKADVAPDQVQEISESGSVAGNEPHVDAVIDLDEDNEGMAAEKNSFKIPAEVPSTSLQVREDSQSPKEALAMDSDSNYSFSEHFDMSAITSSNSRMLAIEENATTTEDNTITQEDVIAQVNVTVQDDAIEQDNATDANDIQEDATESIVASSNEESQATTAKKSREIETLPDFIPLTGNRYGEDNNDDDDEYQLSVGLRSGISNRFVVPSSDDDADEIVQRSHSPLPDLPCEAKIYLTRYHSDFMLSPQGNAFLREKSKMHSVKARLDWTSVGHVLVIFGLPANQNGFHRELLLKYRQLTGEMHNQRSDYTQMVPKRIDVLIRFLRENINQLLTNLGNVNELFSRLKTHETQHSKNGIKLADRARRTLNMILLGQAGLLDGSMHLDKLLTILKRLINDYSLDDHAPAKLRNEIDKHWKMIFSAYRHSNYPQMVRNYNKLLSKNRISNLNIDPALLGRKVLDTTLTNEQKERLEQPSQKQQEAHASPSTPSSTSGADKSSNIVPNPFNPRNSKVLRKRPQKQQLDVPASPSSLITTTAVSTKPQTTSAERVGPLKKQSAANSITPSSTPNIQTTSNVAARLREVNNKWQSTCDSLLTKIYNSGKPDGANTSTITAKGSVDKNGGGGNEDVTSEKSPTARSQKEPSMFWSRESIQYIDECIRLTADNSSMREKLRRVQKKSHDGLLSYNDYRAIIKMHGVILGK